jgi:hypothetical protein
MSVAISNLTARYGSFTGLGSKKRIEANFWFDPNSAVLPNWTPICSLITNSGTDVAQIVVCKPAGLSTYQVALQTLTYASNQTYTLVKTLSQYATSMTDAFHKLRIALCLTATTYSASGPVQAPNNQSALIGTVKLWVDDVISLGHGSNKIQQVQFPASEAGISEIRYGITAVPYTGTSGTVYFDDMTWAENPQDLPAPLSFTFRNGEYIFRMRAKKMDEIYATPKIITLLAGSTPTCSFEGIDVPVLSNPVAYVYQGGTDTTATNMPVGAATVSGNIITTPALADLQGGNKYEVVIEYVVDGGKMLKKTQIEVKDPGDEI